MGLLRLGLWQGWGSIRNPFQRLRTSFAFISIIYHLLFWYFWADLYLVWCKQYYTSGQEQGVFNYYSPFHECFWWSPWLVLHKWLVDPGKPTGMAWSQNNPGKGGAVAVAPALARVPMVMGDPEHSGCLWLHWELSQGMLPGVLSHSEQKDCWKWWKLSLQLSENGRNFKILSESCKKILQLGFPYPQLSAKTIWQSFFFNNKTFPELNTLFEKMKFFLHWKL